MGEITCSVSSNTIHLNQLFKLLNDGQDVAPIRFAFFTYKDNYSQVPFSLVVSRQISWCPVQHLLAYLQAQNPFPFFRCATVLLSPISILWKTFQVYWTRSIEVQKPQLPYRGCISCGWSGYVWSSNSNNGLLEVQCLLTGYSHPTYVQLAVATGRGCCHGTCPLMMRLISKGGSHFIWFHIFYVTGFLHAIIVPYNLYFGSPLLIV